MTTESSFKTSTFSIDAPPNAAFSLSTWFNSQPEDTITILSNHDDGEALTATIEDYTVYLSPSPDCDLANTIDVAVIDGNEQTARNLKTRLQGELSDHLFITDNDYIETHLNRAVPSIVSMARYLDSAITHAKEIRSMLEYVENRTVQAGAEPAAMTGLREHALTKLWCINTMFNKANKILQYITTDLHDNHIRARSYPTVLTHFGERFSHRYRSLEYELTRMDAEEPTNRDIKDTVKDSSDLIDGLIREHTFLKMLVRDYDRHAAKEMESYD